MAILDGVKNDANQRSRTIFLFAPILLSCENKMLKDTFCYLAQ